MTRRLIPAGLIGLAVVPSALAQPPAAPAPSAPPAAAPAATPSQPSNADLLGDFGHYVRINRADLAASFARQLLDRGLTPTQFVDLVEASDERDRFEDTIARAQRVPELDEWAGRMSTLFQRGKLERVRNPTEVTRNIGMLTGIARARQLARERLAFAGEYALPQLLQALLQRKDLPLSAQASRLLVDMGRQAVLPLATALPGLDAGGQELVADILGQIPYRASLPYLVELRDNASASAPGVRAACERAIARLVGAVDADAAELFNQLGEGYYAEKPELTSFPGEEFQLLWAFDPAIGLHPTAIRTEVYHEAMAMRSAERSLRLRRDGNDASVALWVAANFSREIDTPQGYENPAYGSGRRDAMYYGVASGARIAEHVLGRALADRDTPLAFRAIAAMDQTAGGASLWGNGGGALLAALRYPNRRVQYDAALALSRAQPRQAFDGSERVVPILASAIRDARSKYAVVIASDEERYQRLRRILESAAYTVLPAGRALRDVAAPIAAAPGIDLIVSDVTTEATAALIDEARATPALGATPILALATAQGYIDLRREHGRDVSIAIRPAGVDDATVGRAVAELIGAAAGGDISPEDARAYTGRALAVLRDLAVSGNPVFSVEDAVSPLVAALPGGGSFQLEMAEILARVGQPRAQVAIMDAATSATAEQRIALLGKAADSAKRFGNQLEPRQVQRVVAMAGSGSDAEATAAAALMGALNLPNTELVPLILGTKR